MVMGQDLGAGWGAEGWGPPCWLPGPHAWHSVGKSETAALHLVNWSGADSVRVDRDIRVTVCELAVYSRRSNRMIRDSSFMSHILIQNKNWFWVGGQVGDTAGSAGSRAQHVSCAQHVGAPRSPCGRPLHRTGVWEASEPPAAQTHTGFQGSPFHELFLISLASTWRRRAMKSEPIFIFTGICCERRGGLEGSATDMRKASPVI